MTDEEKTAHGINLAETHVDFMIGTPTMEVTGIRSDGSRVPIMRQGMFSGAALSEKTAQSGAAAPTTVATDGPA
jgi:hypothetical protein